MSRQTLSHTALHEAKKESSGMLQRKCACGNAAQPLSGTCEECQQKQALGIQTKLVVSAADDPLEREAERVAAQVLGMPNAPADGLTPSTPRISRQAAMAASGQAVPGGVNAILKSSGEPLPTLARGFFEPRFGHDFSEVKIHRDSQAADAATEVGAQAFTLGRHIVFNHGLFQPATRSGQHLLAHELAHVIQQSGTAGRLQRRPERGRQRMPETAEVRPATDADRREFAQAAIDFLRGQADFFAARVDRPLSGVLRALRQSVQSGLRALAGVSNAEALTGSLHTAYREAVRAVLISRTRSEPDAIRTPPSLQQLYEEHRDEILPFGLPTHQANTTGADELSAELSAPLPDTPTPSQRTRHAAITRARQRLRVVTTAVTMGIEDLFDTSGGRTTIRLPEDANVRFASDIPVSLQHGLRNVAAQLNGSTLSANTTIMLALDLTRFGGSYDSYRFTRLDLGARLGVEILVERQGRIGVEGLRPDQRRQMRERFDRLGFRRSGFSQSEFDQVLIGLAQLADARLSGLGNLRFERAGTSSQTPDAAAEYDQSSHTVRVFDRAFGGGLTRTGTGAQPLQLAASSVVHEIGHALDLAALRTSAAATSTAQQALLNEFGTGGTGYSIPGRGAPDRARYEELRGDVSTAERAERAARSRSGARWSSGQTATVTDTLTRGARQPAFRQAAIRDGAVAGGRGFPTTYPNPDSFWQEYFAEAFMLYRTAPDLLRRNRPHVFDFMQREFP